MFAHNDLRYWVRAIYDMTGVDVRFMVPGYEDVEQADLDTIEGRLEEEDHQNALHMESKWLYIDRALEAVSMRQSDGYSKADSVASFYSDLKRPDKQAYIGLARTNAEKSKGYLNNVPLSFEAVARNPERDGKAVRALNHYRDELLSQNNAKHENEKVIADGHDFGSGIWFTGYMERASKPDYKFLARRRKQGQPLTWEEYQRLEHTKVGHVYKAIDTFKVLRDRRAKGEDAMFFEDPSHTMVTILDTITVTEAMQKYPKVRDKIKAGVSSLQMRTNPSVHKISNDELLTTIKHTYIKMPVRYDMEYQVDVGGGVMGMREDTIDEDVWVRVTRLENAGIAEIAVDEYACGIPLTMWFRRASKYHAYGIGAYKDMHAPEWAFNAAFNGKFRWFNTASKRTTFIMKGALTQEQQKARSKEGTVIEIDPAALPPELRKKSVEELVHTTDIGAFPSIYDNLERDMIYQLDRIGDMSSEKKAYTGRQQAMLDNSQSEGMNPIVGNLEAAFQPLGEKFYSNITQFDEDKPISFVRTDPITEETERVELNIPVGQVEQFDPVTQERKLYTYAVRNGLANLEFDTIIAARGIVPVNPTEKRFWIQDQMNLMFPLTETAKGVMFLEELNKRVMGGMFTEMIDKMKAYDAQMAQLAQQNEEQAMAQLQQEKDREFALKVQELEQNAFRLKEKAESDQDKATAQLMNSIVQFMNGDSSALEGIASDNSRGAVGNLMSR